MGSEMCIRDSNSSNRSSSIYNDTIKIDKISNTNTNSIAIPDHHVIVPKKLLHDIMGDNHKTNEILKRMLPSKIIRELSQNNEMLIPEQYEEVTILFSDIVGIAIRILIVSSLSLSSL